MPYQAKNYTHVQHIAFEAPTFTANTYGNDAYQKELASKINLPYPQNLSLDIKNRILTVVNLIETARNTLVKNGKDVSTCLKVFTIPEFYFRPPKAEAGCLDRSYSEATKNLIVKNLRSMLGRPDYKDWFFVLGSIIWTAKLSKMEGLNAIAAGVNEDDKGVRNTCIMLKGGSIDAPIQLFDKVHLSGINEITQQAWAGKSSTPSKSRPKISQLFESLDSRKNCIFKFDNLTVCADICLDHHDKLKIAQETLGELAKLGQSENVDLHLVIACGMPVKPKSLACRQDGYVIRNDGHGGTPEFSQQLLVNYKKTGLLEYKDNSGKSLKRSDMLNWAYPESKNSINKTANRNNLSEGLTYFNAQKLPA